MSASDVLNAKMGTSLSNSDLLLLHFSFYDDIIERLVELPLNCVLVYHNITPGSFFREVGLEHLANACDGGRKQLNYLAERCKFAVADSNFNGKDLTESGFGDVRTIPVMFNEENLRNKDLDPIAFMKIKESADVNLLFVGRFVPNKRIERIIEIVGKFKSAFPLSIRLHLVGKIWSDDYFASLVKFSASAGVTSNIQFHIDVDDLHLKNLYAASDVFISMSDHEGFMVPLLEAFNAGCPVIALNRAAVGETMGEAGLLLSLPDPQLAAGLVYLLKTDQQLRSRVIAKQYARAMDFRTAKTVAKWKRAITDFATAS